MDRRRRSLIASSPSPAVSNTLSTSISSMLPDDATGPASAAEVSVLQPTEVPRTVFANQADRNGRFCSNRVTNTKYSPWTFLPKSLFEQFRRFMNFYFLIIACLQLFPSLTPVSPVTTWLPLSIIFLVSSIKEGFDDYQRYLADKAANTRVFAVIRNGMLSNMLSQDIRPGDIVRVDNDCDFPSDLVLLISSESDGSCFVQTANVDGETDLKPRQAIPETSQMSIDDVRCFKGVVECPQPSNVIYNFDARIKLRDNEADPFFSLSARQLLLQGTFLKNTEYVFGVAVYTGHETKLGKNKNQPKTKLTKVDRLVDRATWFIFAIQATLVISFGIIGNIFQSGQFQRHFYLAYDVKQEKNPLVIPFRMMLLLSYMIPISLKVTLEVTKFYYAKFIDWDPKMCDDTPDGFAQASNTAISEDLGQIEHIFTDKTGTLTDNRMIFKKCSISGIVYGSSDADLYTSLSLKNLIESAPVYSDDVDFFRTIALCHSLSVTQSLEGFIYQGPSPDEESLVQATSKIGVEYRRKEGDILTIHLRGVEEQYILLCEMAFSSDRKRMSVVVQEMFGNKRIRLLSKGADDVMLNASKDGVSVREALSQHIDVFAQEGYRTLCLGIRDISETEFEAWEQKFHTANTSIHGREAALNNVYKELENGIHLIGAAAIEDRLQDGVPETIQLLRQAGIKVWMLTGDKRATAVQIAVSCHLISPEPWGLHVHLSMATSPSRPNLPPLPDEVSTMVEKAIDDVMANTRPVISYSNDSPPSPSPQGATKTVSVIVDGLTLRNILKYDSTKVAFIELCNLSQTVICCRVTPHQKSEVVALMKKRGHTTLSVGDGGNDVSMIQQANIGVGLRGREGLQAARAADYSITRFRHLSRLILIHGRYSYNRSSFVAQYCFYKSIYICVMQALYEGYCAFSGTSFLNTYALSTYNIIFTAFPVLFYMLDKDIPEDTVLHYPHVYRESVEGVLFNIRTFAGWIIRAVMQALTTIFIIVALFGGDSETSSNGDLGIEGMSIAAFASAVTLQTMMILLESHTFTIYNHIAIWGTWFLFFPFTIGATSIKSLEIYGIGRSLFAEPVFWMTIMLVAAACSIPIYAIKFYRLVWSPKVAERILYVLRENGAHAVSQFEMQTSFDGAGGTGTGVVSTTASPRIVPLEKANPSMIGVDVTESDNDKSRTSSANSAIPLFKMTE